MKAYFLLLLFAILVASSVEARDTTLEARRYKTCVKASDCGESGWACCQGRCQRMDGEFTIASCQFVADAPQPSDVTKRDTTESPEISPKSSCQTSSDCGGDQWYCCRKRCYARVNGETPPCARVGELGLEDLDIDFPLNEEEVELARRGEIGDPTPQAEGADSADKPKPCEHWWNCGVNGEHQWACCNKKCLKWYPGSTPWIRPKCLPGQ
ncbi:hypothetical protein BDV25DRAFT_140667 [Aspergillus avenaceus]|uniref:WAP domain-containing protein n=1 Tax=Aspergillus avenaceus TaxID=36643 RepID=A0A5N6TT60_ASPAV|nr:hypothetical protein BDV25DRAFT_140667 [Aspergillus avenaceus]